MQTLLLRNSAIQNAGLVGIFYWHNKCPTGKIYTFKFKKILNEVNFFLFKYCNSSTFANFNYSQLGKCDKI